MATQLKLLSTTTASRHGGGKEKGRRKTRRPLTPKLALHVTFRSSQARGKLTLLHPERAQRIQTKLQAIARRFHVRVYQYANSGNHSPTSSVAKPVKAFRIFSELPAPQSPAS